MRENEKAFLAQVALGWFSIMEDGAIWRNIEFHGGKGATVMTWVERRRAEVSESADEGYLRVMFHDNGERKQVAAHRIAWMWANKAEIPEPMEVNHKDGVKYNNHPSNLELLTHAENTLHSFRELARRVKDQRGAKNTSSKLDESKVLEVRSLCASGVPQSRIAKQFGVSQRTVSEVHLRKTWQHVP